MQFHSKIIQLFHPTKDQDLVYSMLALRKRLFVDQMGWELDDFGEIEVDQYDNPNSRYVVVYDDDRNVVGCTRLLPTTNKLMTGYSYMIRDASLGRLDGLPSELIEGAPISENVWEATRFAVEALPVRQRNEILTLVCQRAVEFAQGQGITEILGLMSPFFLRWLPKAGFPVSAAGPTVVSSGDPCCVIRYSIN
jgi:N-acyl-L-homoserine lactone synthetase